MSYSIQVIQNEIKRISAREVKIDAALKYSPAIELLNLRRDLHKKLSGGEDRLSKSFMVWIEAAAKMEKKLKLEMTNHQIKQQKLWDERENNLRNLNDLSNTHSLLNIRQSR